MSHVPLLALACGMSAAAWCVESVAQNRNTEAPGRAGSRRALLVGCTKYDNLNPIRHLEGPGNDVIQLKQVLIERFHTPENNIVVLSETAGPDNRPTRRRIEEEFSQLARVAQQDDQVLILLAGHGSRQPDQDPPDPEDPEPDGLDETFLPADVEKWNGGSKTLANAIVDDELRKWTQSILDRGAYVTVIFDCCNSGTALRGDQGEISREVPPSELGIPREALGEAASRVSAGEPRRSENPRTGGFDARRTVERLTAIYAAQSSEPTVELPMPPDSKEQARHGLFTFTLCQVLRTAHHPLSSREALRRVRARYEQMGRTYGPTPLIEGGKLDRALFGQQEFPNVPWTRLERRQDTWRVTAGQLNGLTNKSVLAVYPQTDGLPADEPVGHVEVIDCGALTSEVRPCAFGSKPIVNNLPSPAICRPVLLDYGDLTLNVAVDSTLEATRANAAAFGAGLQTASQNKGAMFRVVPLSGSPQWIVRQSGMSWELLPTLAWQFVGTTGGPEGAPRLQFPMGPGDIAALSARLNSIARAQNLLTVAGAQSPAVPRVAGEQLSNDVNIVIETRRFKNRMDPTGELVTDLDPEFRAGEYIGWTLENKSERDTADVTLLFIDSAQKIHAVFPRSGSEAGARLPPRSRPIRVGPYRVNDNTLGPEKLVAIAVRGTREEPRVFTMLAESSLERARSLDRGGVMQRGLGALLERSVYAQGLTTRGLELDEIADFRLELTTWRVVKAGVAPPVTESTQAAMRRHFPILSISDRQSPLSTKAAQ